MKVEVIVPAAGFGLRMGAKVPKPLINIGRQPILIHTLRALAKNKHVQRIIVAVNKENKRGFEKSLKRFHVDKSVELAEGGLTRGDSVANCLKRLRGDTDIVVVHDAVRPFVAARIIEKVIQEAKKSGAAIIGVPLKPTIKEVNSQREVVSTLPREKLWEAQTPQAFKKEILLKAYDKFVNARVTDDASLVEKLGIKVKVVEGSYFNIKITTPEDLVLGEAILKSLRVVGTAQCAVPTKIGNVA